MPDDKALALIPAAFSGCAYDETCKNLKVMEAYRVQLAKANEWMQKHQKLNELASENVTLHERLAAAEGERDAALARERALRAALQLIANFDHVPTCTARAVPVYECGCYEKSQAEIAAEALAAAPKERCLTAREIPEVVA